MNCGAQTPENNLMFPDEYMFKTYEEAKNFWNKRP
jgi:hypothetical protein